MTPWPSIAVRLLAVSTALLLTTAAPSEKTVMGKLPSFMARTLNQQTISVPGGLPAERTLALIAFRSTQREHIEGCVQGLSLREDPSICWMRMPVINDPGSHAARSVIETKLMRHYPADSERARLMPVFTDRDQFVRAAGLAGTDQVYAVVINREGEVLARAGGEFDADRASSLRETLRQSGL